MTKTYECSICYAINHVARTHCQCCGTVPAAYSFVGKTINVHSTRTDGNMPYYIVAAQGCKREGLFGFATCKS